MKINKNEGKNPYLMNYKSRINELFQLPIFFFQLSLDRKKFWFPFFKWHSHRMDGEHFADKRHRVLNKNFSNFPQKRAIGPHSYKWVTNALIEWFVRQEIPFLSLFNPVIICNLSRDLPSVILFLWRSKDYQGLRFTDHLILKTCGG